MKGQLHTLYPGLDTQVPQPAEITEKKVLHANDLAFKLIPKSKTPEFIIKTICTSSPYFALKKLEILSENTVSAQVPVETFIPRENSVISAAEVGRHLAILGSCAASLIDESFTKKYFLAIKAELNYLDPSFKASKESLYAIASAFQYGERKTLSKVNLYTKTGKRVYSLSVVYQIFQEKVFERLFSSHFTLGNENFGFNPYVEFLHLHNLSFEENKLKATVGPILAEYCLGHFKNYPALPVAVIMGNLSYAAGKLLHNILGEECQYHVQYADVVAENLAFVDDMLVIDIELKGRFDDHFFFLCQAINQENKTIGKMFLELVKE